jgi:hypothetical protein
VASRLAIVGVKVKIGCHTFRATGISACLSKPATPSKMPTPWQHTKARAPPGSTTALATSMRSSGLTI